MLLRCLPAALLVAAACSSPADVEATHRSEQEHYATALAKAHEWNHHVLGIPAAGWVAILVAVGVALAILLGYLAYLLNRRSLTRLHEQGLQRQREYELARAKLARGNCAVCGASPDLQVED